MDRSHLGVFHWKACVGEQCDSIWGQLREVALYLIYFGKSELIMILSFLWRCLPRTFGLRLPNPMEFADLEMEESVLWNKRRCDSCINRKHGYLFNPPPTAPLPDILNTSTALTLTFTCSFIFWICGLIFSQIWILTVFLCLFFFGSGGKSAIKNASKKFGRCPKVRWLMFVRALFTTAGEGCFKIFSHTTTRISKLAIWNRYCTHLFWVAPKKCFLYLLYVTMCPHLSLRLVLWSLPAHPFSLFP